MEPEERERAENTAAAEPATERVTLSIEERNSYELGYRHGTSDTLNKILLIMLLEFFVFWFVSRAEQ